ncbi:MAG TPA: hypothetical protein VK162_01730, partial [Streptosporangiaceae bacterium]|nr:hypothetical protein [Streptosporangiaceae bacterium]
AAFSQRMTHPVPAVLPDPPAFWAEQYANLVAELDVEARTITEALDLLRRWWQQVTPYLES